MDKGTRRPDPIGIAVSAVMLPVRLQVKLLQGSVGAGRYVLDKAAQTVIDEVIKRVASEHTVDKIFETVQQERLIERVIKRLEADGVFEEVANLAVESEQFAKILTEAIDSELATKTVGHISHSDAVRGAVSTFGQSEELTSVITRQSGKVLGHLANAPKRAAQSLIGKGTPRRPTLGA